MRTVSAQSDNRYSFEFNNETLDQALYIISQTTGADIIYESQLTKGVSVSAVFRDERIDPMLGKLLFPAGLEARRIRTGMYVLRYSLRRKLNPIRNVPAERVADISLNRFDERLQFDPAPVPLRDRPLFWQ